jgi:hypothetical protein
LGFQGTLGALARPVAVQGHSLLRRREAPSQTLVGPTAMGVLLRDAQVNVRQGVGGATKLESNGGVSAILCKGLP